VSAQPLAAKVASLIEKRDFSLVVFIKKQISNVES
jgi:hypothetical protein